MYILTVYLIHKPWPWGRDSEGNEGSDNEGSDNEGDDNKDHKGDNNGHKWTGMSKWTEGKGVDTYVEGRYIHNPSGSSSSSHGGGGCDTNWEPARVMTGSSSCSNSTRVRVGAQMRGPAQASVNKQARRPARATMGSSSSNYSNSGALPPAFYFYFFT
jgi:hypothetical protein